MKKVLTFEKKRHILYKRTRDSAVFKKPNQKSFEKRKKSLDKTSEMR